MRVMSFSFPTTRAVFSSPSSSNGRENRRVNEECRSRSAQTPAGSLLRRETDGIFFFFVFIYQHRKKKTHTHISSHIGISSERLRLHYQLDADGFRCCRTCSSSARRMIKKPRRHNGIDYRTTEIMPTNKSQTKYYKYYLRYLKDGGI